ncbi:MAG TPA: FG-GAP-like repeat-containing protein [Pirellulaceae bacterium]
MLAIDFGDAPDSGPGTATNNYQTLLADNGPRHDISATQTTLFLGAKVDGEVDATPSVQANGDDTTTSDDEDGLVEPAQDLLLTVGTTPTVRVHATNLTDLAATLYGWIDYDSDGVFDNVTERASIAVPTDTTNKTFSLTFPTIPLTTLPGVTYARFRLSADPAAGDPTGLAIGGEVEDYPASIIHPSDGSANSAKTELLTSSINGGPRLANNDLFGSSVSSLGDLDGDGVTDLAVGTISHDPGGDHRGKVYVLFMNADGTVKRNVELASGSNGVPTLVNDDSFGISVASLGDLDGDGVTDLAVGAVGDDTGGENCGAVYVLFMKADGTVKNSVKLASDTNGVPQLGGFLYLFGTSVASLGDLDGDGVPDLAVGATGDSTGGSFSARGAVYVLFMNSNGTVRSSVKLASLTSGLPALDDLTFFGTSVASLGDLDGDGVTDLAVGAPGVNAEAGAVYVILMNANGTVKRSTRLTSDENNAPLLSTFDLFGSSVANLGDLDGDGVTDLAVGAIGDDTGGDARGAVDVLFMKADGAVKCSVKLASDINGGPTLADNSAFGASVAVLGDLDGDGLPELAIGANDATTNGVPTGAVQVLFLNSLPGQDFGDAPNTPWHNRQMPADVTGDGNVDAEDVLDVINYINAKGAGPVVSGSAAVQSLAQAVGASGTMYYDVTGDNYIAADDVVTIINCINAHPGDQEASSGTGAAQVQVVSELTASSSVQSANALLLMLAADSAAAAKRRK